MKESIVAKAYASSIYKLGDELNIDVTKELTDLTILINENNNLETVMFLDVFTIEEKTAVINDVLSKMDASSLIKNIIGFLLQEKRLGILPLIFKEVTVLDDHKKGFLRGVIEGREEKIPEDIKAQLVSYLKTKVRSEPVLSYKQNEKLTAGYRVTVEDLQLDATLDNQLNKLKSEILNS